MTWIQMGLLEVTHLLTMPPSSMKFVLLCFWLPLIFTTHSQILKINNLLGNNLKITKFTSSRNQAI